MYKRGIFQKQRPTTEENIAATAITYFKRFFLHKSLVEVDHPVAIMCASDARPHSRVGVYSHSSDIDGVPVQAGCAVHCHENRRGVVWRNVG